jgi:hypothetical protein
MAQSNYPLRLQTSLLEEARQLAAEEGASVNQFINTAVAEKIASLRAWRKLRERAARGDLAKALEILKRAGSETPRAGDEVETSLAEDAAPYRQVRRPRSKAGSVSRKVPRRKPKYT